MISCDQCQDWQHLECHHRADLEAGRTVDYATVDFICAKCKVDPSRAKQTRGAPVAYSPAVAAKEKKAYKPREKKAPVRPPSLLIQTRADIELLQAAKPKPKARQSYDVADKGYGTPNGQAQQRVQAAAPAAPSPQLDYAALLAMVIKDNSILLQLPENYQKHFAEKLGLNLSTVADSIVVPPQAGGSSAGNGF